MVAELEPKGEADRRARIETGDIHMRASFKTSVALSLATLGLSLGLATTSAHAHMFMGGGGGHFGGFGHYFGGVGGFGPMGGFMKPFPGPVGPIGWNHHHHGFGWGYGGYDGDSCIVWRPIYDSYGDYLGRRPVDICE
jgi:hypothetical protein